MEHVPDLGAKLELAMKALSVSRVSLSRELGVDKSLIGRWMSGAVHPTEHNLARITGLVAGHDPGFRMADWFGDLAGFARHFRMEPPKARGASTPGARILGEGPLAKFIASAQPELDYRGAAYQGFWRTARPSLLMRERVFHDYCLVRPGDDGLLEVRIEGSGLRFEGWMFPIGGNVFVFLFDVTGRTPMNVVFRGVSLPKAMVLDGILMLAALDADRTPAAVPVVLERLGDLSGDAAQDRATWSRMVVDEPEPLDPVPTRELEARLFRDVGPTAAAAGGEPFFAVSGARSLSRGVTAAGLRG